MEARDTDLKKVHAREIADLSERLAERINETGVERSRKARAFLDEYKTNSVLVINTYYVTQKSSLQNS